MKADFMLSRRFVLKIRVALAVILIFSPLSLFGQDFFRFYAPPGAVYLNGSFEREETVTIPITIEHFGVAIPEWFLTVSTGNSGLFNNREVNQGSFNLIYYIYNEPPPSTNIIMAPPEILTLEKVVTSSDFNSIVGTVEQVTFNLYYFINSGQFSASGEYNDTVTLTLYEGDYADSGTHVAVDTVDIAVVVRMAELIDLYADREPDNRYLDLTRDLTNKRIAMVNERSNSPLGYEVSLTSRNMAADGAASSPFFIHESDEDRLDYYLAYDGVPVGSWLAGESLITDASGITSPEWLSKELTLSFLGDPGLVYGEYEDILTITIRPK
jgi:hypothetical protein